ncbi:hypothetical protein F3K02_24400, partial [Hydrogenophaga sp. D2P1]
MAADTEGVQASSQIPVSGRRVAIAVVCWLLSSVGLLMSLMVFTATAVTALVNEPFFQVVNDPKFCLGLAVAYAWSSLAVMTIAWVG